MKKKFFASILASALALSSLISMAPVNAATTDEVGGLDFYSITFHYENEILVDCNKSDFSDEKSKEMSNQLVIKAGVTTGGNFYQVQYDDDISSDCYYTRIPKRNAFITHITNGSAISSYESVNLLGFSDPYDSNPYVNQNPNIKYAEDGYALSTKLDANGNNCKIDQNGFIVHDDNVWRTIEGNRVEAFVQVPVIKKTGTVNKKGIPDTEIILSDEYDWIPFDERFDENGKIKNTQHLGYVYMLTKEEYEAFLEDDTKQEMKLYRADEETEKEAYRKSEQEVWAQLCLVNSDPNKAADFAIDKTFTNDDIVRDGNGYVSFASPEMGSPLSSVKIVDVTVEIDALGAQLYDDLSQDPQQKNTIKVSLNDCGFNAETYKKWYDEGCYTADEFAELGVYVLGTAKSQTTRTSIETNKKNYKDGLSPTTKSISLELNQDTINNLPADAQIYIDFSIGENQPAEAYDDNYFQTMIYDDSFEGELDSDTVELLTDDLKPTSNKKVETNKTQETDDGLSTTTIVLIICGGVVLVAVVVVIIIFIKRKNTESQS